MSYDKKIAKARELLISYKESIKNSNDGESSGAFDVQDFFTKLKNIGCINEDLLSEATWEDITDCGIPKILARKIAKIFREKETRYFSKKDVADMSLEELLEKYNPYKKSENEITKRLQDISEGLPFLIFDDSGKLLCRESAKCLKDIEDGYESNDIFVVDGVPYKTYPVFESPPKILDENPLFPGEALRGSDQLCGRTMRSWKTFSHRHRALLRVALGTKELKLRDYSSIHDLFDSLLPIDEKGREEYISRRYPKAFLRYKELCASSNTISLKVSKKAAQKRKGKIIKKNDPFFFDDWRIPDEMR